MPVLTALEVADDPARWRDAGFTVEDDVCVIGGVAIRLRPSEKKGVRGWSFDVPVEGDVVDGIPTSVSAIAASSPAGHANGATGIDHVVVVSPDVDRTIGAFGSSLGVGPRRERRTESYGSPMRQVFFTAGEVILELVGPDEPAGDRRAGFFGLAITVDDLDATKSLLGDGLGDPKDAVQPGRRIATLRSSMGLTTPIAFMSPEP